MGSVRAASEVDGLLQILRLLATPPGAHHAPTLSFWMANSSELLHFLKSDRHITAFSLQVGHRQGRTRGGCTCIPPSPPPQAERLVMRKDGRGGGGSAKNVQPPRQNPRYAPGLPGLDWMTKTLRLVCEICNF